MRATVRKTAVILSGGVAKGAFEAGALTVLANKGFDVTQVVGASSGSLNATMYAASVRAGRERDAAALSRDIAEGYVSVDGAKKDYGT